MLTAIGIMMIDRLRYVQQVFFSEGFQALKFLNPDAGNTRQVMVKGGKAVLPRRYITRGRPFHRMTL